MDELRAGVNAMREAQGPSKPGWLSARARRVTPARHVARPAPQARLRTLDESSISYESGRQPELAGSTLKSIGRFRLVRERKE